MMLVLAMLAQQCSVYTHRILCDDTFVNFIEFFCIGPVHVELWGGNITHVKHNNVQIIHKKQKEFPLIKWKYFTQRVFL